VVYLTLLSELKIALCDVEMIGKEIERSVRDLTRATVWRDRGKPRETSVNIARLRTEILTRRETYLIGSNSMWSINTTFQILVYSSLINTFCFLCYIMRVGKCASLNIMRIKEPILIWRSMALERDSVNCPEERLRPCPNREFHSVVPIWKS
jgi:hypothetical protein